MRHRRRTDMKKAPEKEVLTPQGYRKTRNMEDDYFAELSVGKVRIQPENIGDLFRIFADMGILGNVPDKVAVSYDSEGKPSSPNLDFQMDTMKAMMGWDALTERRACGITVEPRILPVPKNEQGHPIPLSDRDQAYLYWDELTARDRKALEQALELPEIGGMKSPFRSQKPGNTDPLPGSG
jgi:hypothetical protein